MTRGDEQGILGDSSGPSGQPSWGRPEDWQRAEAAEERLQRSVHPIAYRALRRIARRGPVVRVPRVGVVVSDARVARSILLDTAAFSKVGPGSPSDLWTPVLGSSVLLNMEGADHQAMRQQLAGLFTPRAVRDQVGRHLPSVMDRLTKELLRGAEVDLASYAARMAGVVICALTGMDAQDATVRRAIDVAHSITGLVRLHRPSLTARQVAGARRALEGLSAPARRAYRRGDPSSVPGRLRELGLGEDEAIGAIWALVITGTETVQSFLPRMVTVAFDGGFLDEFTLAPPAQRDPVADEIMRLTVPTPVMLRSVTASALVGDVAVAPGDRVVIATVNCCRGKGPFAPASPIDLRHLWFGAGPHFCLGRPLAVAHSEAWLGALGAVVGAGRSLRVVGREPARRALIPAYRAVRVRAA